MSFFSTESGLSALIHESMARAIFVSAWADAEEAAGRSFGGGTELMDVAPETDERAMFHAAAVIGKIEQANGLGLAAIYSQACQADGVIYEHACIAAAEGEHRYADLRQHAKDFGHCLGMMSLGAGVSWFDDHERFQVHRGFGEMKPLVVPLSEFSVEVSGGEQSLPPLSAPSAKNEPTR